MYNNPLKIPILQEASLCSYPPNMKDYIVNAVIEVMGYPYKEQQPKYIRKKIGNDTIIMLWFSLSIPFNTKKYNIPINIYFMKNLPYEPPQVFIEVLQGSAVNPKATQIDQQTHRIMTPLLTMWNQYATFTAVMEEIRQSFVRVFPIYKKPVNQPPMVNNLYGQPQPQMQSGYVGFQGMGGGNTFQRTGTSFYGQAMNPNPTTMSMPNPQPSYGVQPQNNLYGTNNTMNTNPPNNTGAFSQYQKGNPEDEVKQILINEAREKVEPKLLKETKSVSQQAVKLNNYLNQFKIDTEKITNYLQNPDEMIRRCENDMNAISQEVYNLTQYNNANRGKDLSGENCMSYIKISENDQKAISLIAKEAYYEEVMAICKKGFEKQNLPFSEAVRFIRNSARDLFAVKFKREKLLN